MCCILQLYTPNCSYTLSLALSLALTYSSTLSLPFLRCSCNLLWLRRRRPAISQQFNFLLCQQVESNAMLIKCCPSPPLPLPAPLAVNIKGKLKMSAAVRASERERERQCKQRQQHRVYATWCAFVLTSLPIYPPHTHTHTQSTTTQQWPIYPNMCAACWGGGGGRRVATVIWHLFAISPKPQWQRCRQRRSRRRNERGGSRGRQKKWEGRKKRKQ